MSANCITHAGRVELLTRIELVNLDLTKIALYQLSYRSKGYQPTR